MMDADCETPDYIPIQARQIWRDAWNQAYQTAIDDGEDDTGAEVRAYLAAQDAAFAAVEPVKEGTVDEKQLLKIFSFRIVDKADGTHSVDGIATSQTRDHDGERADFKGTLAAIKTWSDEFAKTTRASGQQLSLGNIRVQHDGKKIGGKVTAIEPDDDSKAIAIKTQPLTSVYEELIEPGMVTGFSIAGRYAKQWEDAKGDKWYIPEITEISYVDHPCNPDAGFTHVKATGATEFRKFASPETREAALRKTIEKMDGEVPANILSAVAKTVRQELIDAGIIKAAKTKRVAGEDLPASCFAYVGDAEDTGTWKLPYKGFSTEAKNKSHVRNALARFNQTQGIPSGEKAKVKSKLVSAAKKHGIEVSDKSVKAVRAAIVRVLCDHTNDEGKVWIERSAAEEMVKIADEILSKLSAETVLIKGMYTVGTLAQIMDQFSWIVASTEYERDYEQDDSSVPDDLRTVLEDLIPVFVAMATEEAKELLNNSQKTANGGLGGKSMTDTAADLLKAAQELWKKAKSAFHKIAKEHDGVCKCFGKAADHHEDMADHHMAAAEACADKAVTDEITKLADGAEFKKSEKVDQILAKAEILITKASGHAKMFGKMAKCHGNIAKCMDKAAGHHDELGKAAVAVGSAEDTPGETGGSSKEEEEAKKKAAEADRLKKEADDKAAVDAIAKGANADLVKIMQDGFAGVKTQISGVETRLSAVETDVKKQGDRLEETPAEKATRLARLADPSGAGREAGNGDVSKNPSSILDPARVSKGSQLGAAGMFGKK